MFEKQKMLAEKSSGTDEEVIEAAENKSFYIKDLEMLEKHWNQSTNLKGSGIFTKPSLSHKSN